MPHFFLTNRNDDEMWICAPNAGSATDQFRARIAADNEDNEHWHEDTDPNGVIDGRGPCEERVLCARCGGTQASLGAALHDRDTPGGEGPCGDLHRWITVAHTCQDGRLNVAVFDDGELTHDGIAGAGLPLHRFPIGAQPYISELMSRVVPRRRYAIVDAGNVVLALSYGLTQDEASEWHLRLTRPARFCGVDANQLVTLEEGATAKLFDTYQQPDPAVTKVADCPSCQPTFRNLTPHRITVFPEGSMDNVAHTPTARVISAAEAHLCPAEELHYPESWSIEPDGEVARVSVHETPDGDHAGIPLAVPSYGPVTGLPEPELGVLLIVSQMVVAACPKRHDLVHPGTLVRDSDGRIIGCKSLYRRP